MPKPYTFPILIDHLPRLNITNLKNNGYLDNNCLCETSVRWGNSFARLHINSITETPFIIIRHQVNETEIKYRVNLISKPSNLKLGCLWFFECPISKKLCRNLYLFANIFRHRETISGGMYECQTYPKLAREMIRLYKILDS
jgi:hypothetical protein